jgi:hypothetical protein
MGELIQRIGFLDQQDQRSHAGLYQKHPIQALKISARLSGVQKDLMR